MGSTAGMATDRGTSTWALEQVSCLRSLVGWFDVVGLHFGSKVQRIWVREEERWEHGNRSYMFKNLSKI